MTFKIIKCYLCNAHFMHALIREKSADLFFFTKTYFIIIFVFKLPLHSFTIQKTVSVGLETLSLNCLCDPKNIYL